MKKKYVISSGLDFVFCLQLDSGLNIPIGECFGGEGQAQKTAKKVIKALNFIENLPNKKIIYKPLKSLNKVHSEEYERLKEMHEMIGFNKCLDLIQKEIKPDITPKDK